MSFIIYFSSILLAGIGAWFVSRHAYLLGLIDQPNERSSHTRPTPKGGGIGILIALITVCILKNISILFWMPVTFLSLLSFFGDRINLNPGLRLIVQFCVTFFVLSYMGMSFENPAYRYYNFLKVILIFTFFAVFVVGTANFYNFMDGINGIAGITGIAGFGLLGIYGILTQQNPKWIMLAFAMVCACAGFLPFNIPKARVFMGDVGSILLGFVFACMIISFAQTLSDFVILVCFMFPFYIDELVTMLERIIDRQRLTLPHRRHFYQVLTNEAGIAHWKVSVGYGLVQLVAGLIIWFLVLQNLLLGMIGIFSITSLFFIINMRVKKKHGCWIRNNVCV